MRIEKIDANGKNQILEKITLEPGEVLFQLSDRNHRPILTVFKDVNEPQFKKSHSVALVPGV